MHQVAGRPMIAHLLAALEPLSPAATVAVIGPRMDAVARLVAPAQSVVQDPPRGTGDAVRTGLAALTGRLAPKGEIDDVLVLYGDTPLLQQRDLGAAAGRRSNGRRPRSLLAGMRPADPGPYGRLVSAPDGQVLRIVEATDASPEERAIGLCNGGIMADPGAPRVRACRRGRPRQRQKRILPDRHRRIARPARGSQCRMVELPAEELLGVNTRAELAEAEALMQGRLRRARDGRRVRR